MIIEFVNVDSAPPMVLIHMDMEKDNQSVVVSLSHRLIDELPAVYKVIIVPNGQPCPNNPLPKVTLYNWNNTELTGILSQITSAKPGEFIALTKEQINLYINAIKNGDLITI